MNREETRCFLIFDESVMNGRTDQRTDGHTLLEMGNVRVGWRSLRLQEEDAVFGLFD